MGQEFYGLFGHDFQHALGRVVPEELEFHAPLSPRTMITSGLKKPVFTLWVRLVFHPKILNFRKLERNAKVLMKVTQKSSPDQLETCAILAL